MARVITEKYKVGGLVLPDVQTYYKALAIKTCGAAMKTATWDSRIPERIGKKLPCHVPRADKGVRATLCRITALSTTMLGTPTTHVQKKEQHTQNQLKWTRGRNVGPETMKCRRKYCMEKQTNRTSWKLLNIHQKYYQQNKREPTEWEKTIANHVSYKGLIPRTYRDSPKTQQ